MNVKIMKFEVRSLEILLAIALFGASANAYSETLTFSSFRIEVEDAWVNSLEKTPQAHNEMSELISIYHPNGNGILKMQTVSAADFVTRETLRNMTNVERSTPLTWQDWGDYSGYQYEYSEAGSSYRQWWLVNQRTIIFVVYENSVEPTDIEIYEIDKIVNSMTVNAP